MKKICVVTSTRAEYGSLKWLMKELESSDIFCLQIIVSGAHLLKEQGCTVDEIIADGFSANKRVDGFIDTSSPAAIAESMGRIAEGMATAFSELLPDYIVVLGDRYELLPICSTAFVMRIPIIHISGGDVTEGAIDDGIRNAVTMLSSFHFTSTDESMNNVIRMRGNTNNIWKVGALELDAIIRDVPMSREELSRDLDINQELMWVLLTYHSETNSTPNNDKKVLRNIIMALSEIPYVQIIATYSNADFGGRSLNEFLQDMELKMPDKLRVIPSLGHRRYLSALRQVQFVIGNSSSGITESPMLNVSSINIGNRQKGRHQCSNIIQCTGEINDIRAAIKSVANNKQRAVNDLNYWGDGHACERIVDILSKEIG